MYSELFFFLLCLRFCLLDNIGGLLFSFLDILNNEPDATFPDEIEEVLDVDEVLRFLAVSTLVVHLDNYIAMGHNYYLYENHGKFAIIPWDLNMAFGTFNYGINLDGIINYYIDEPTGGPMEERPLVSRLLSHQPYLDAYHGYLEELLEGPFSIEVMEARIEELADLIRPYVQADELKFFSTEDFERSISDELKGLPGGAAPQFTQPTTDLPRFSQETLACLKENIPRDRLTRILQRGPNREELNLLKSCLSEEEFALFLQQFSSRPLPVNVASPRPVIGLMAFVVERGESVREQLDGSRKAGPGDGSGNGGSFGAFRNRPVQPPQIPSIRD